MTSINHLPDSPLSLADTDELVSSGAVAHRDGRRVLVVLPAFNEGAALPPLLDAISATLEDGVLEHEIIVVDDGSADDTAMVASQASFHYPVRVVRHEQNRGLAAALRTGLEAAVADAGPGDIIVTMDADNTQPPGLLPRMLAMINEGHDLVIASRFQPGARVVGVPLYRNLLSRASLVLFKLALPIHGVRDYTCGYRAYRAAPLADAMRHYGDRFVSEQGFSCMVDVLLKLRGRGLVMGEAPMILRYDQKPGESKMNVLRTIRQTLSLIVRRRLGR